MIPLQEVGFLVLHWLRAGPCEDAAAAFEREALENGLLPRVADFQGADHSVGYDNLAALFSHIPPSALEEVCSEARRLHSHAARQGPEAALPSLLYTSGPGSLIPSVRQRPSLQSLCMGSYSHRPSAFQQLLQREIGVARSCNRSQVQLSSEILVKQWKHLGTFRGHRTAVYCAIATQDGKYVVTGSDDCLVKIWNTRLRLLKATCRSHMGEITDICLNEDQTVVASASTDCTVRIWSLKEGELGRHLQVLVGHTSAVSFIDFHPVLPTALLSSSFDGTCALWDTANGEAFCFLKPGPSFASGRGTARFDSGGISTRSRTAAGEDHLQEARPQGQGLESQGLSCCSFSPNGECFVATSKSGTTFMWSWQVMGGRTRRRGPRTREQAAAGIPDIDNEGPLDPENWPQPTELCILEGHQADVSLAFFSHNGCALATASRDGQVRVWRPPKKKTRTSVWMESLTLGTPVAPTSSRRRHQAPSVNQVAWRCDDRWLLAAYSNASIYVWDALSGDEVHHLQGHTSQVHVLECHPFDPRLCLSAGYDGFTILWDIEKGSQLVRFSSVDTHPGPCKWADPIQLADGHFMPDGQGVFLSDVTGQFSLYGPGQKQLKSPYDQFFLLDYDPVFQNEDGEVVDAESMEPQHQHGVRFSMCDYGGVPYNMDLQTAVRTSSLRALPDPADPPVTPSGLLLHPPTATAAAWEATEKGLSQHSTNTKIQEAIERQNLLEQAAIAQAMEAERRRQEPQPPPFVLEEDEVMTNEADLDTVGFEEAAAPEVEITAEVVVDEDGYLLPDAGEYPSDSGAGGEDAESDYVQSSDEEEEDEFRQYTRRRRRRVRMSLTSQASGRSHSTLEEDEIPDDEDGRANRASPSCSSEEDSHAAGGSRRRQVRRPSRYSNGVDVESSRRQRGRKRRRNGGGNRGRGHVNENKGRHLSSYRWLQETAPMEQFYVPQLGDDIVYLIGVHQQWFDEHPHNGTVMPHWAEVGNLRFAEPCKVTHLEYVILGGQEGKPTVARMTLTFTDVSMRYSGSQIVVDAPPPNFGHEEFIIERTRWRDAVEKRWHVGDFCKAWYFNQDAEGGAWWNAVVVEDTLEADHIDPTDWECAVLHKRYRVQWDGNSYPDIEHVSPWDLFARSVGGGTSTRRSSVSLAPGLEDLVASCIFQNLERVIEMPEAEHFRETLDPNSCFPCRPCSRGRSAVVYYNNMVALPISFSTIRERLQAPVYYRQLDAVKWDLHTIVENAHLFNGHGSEISKQAQSICNVFLETMLDGDDTSQSPDIPRQPRSRGTRGRRQTMEDRVTFVRSLDEPGPSNGVITPMAPQHQETLESERVQTRSSARNRGRQKRRREEHDDHEEDGGDDQSQIGILTRSRRNVRRQI